MPGVSLKPTQVVESDKVTYPNRKWKEIQEAAIEKVVECLDGWIFIIIESTQVTCRRV